MANAPKKKNSSTTSATKAGRRSAPSGRPAGLFTWAAVGLVVLVILVLVAVKVVSSPTASTVVTSSATPATIVSELTSIPASTFNAVGVTSPAVAIYDPLKTKGQKILQLADSAGVKRPTVFFYCAEYHPVCASLTWPTVIALSRFGTISGLYNVNSAPNGPYKGTPSFTFSHVRYVSKWINFFSVESSSNVPYRGGFQPLQTLSPAELTIVKKYDTKAFIPYAQSPGQIPFITFANQVILGYGSIFTPAALVNTTRDAVAANLADPTNPLSQALVASANLQIASICKMIHNADTAVCGAPGTKAAIKALRL